MNGTSQIDRSDSLPLYLQIKNRVLEMIAKGEVPKGPRGLSERKLALQFGVSRMTARQALTQYVYW